jgi:hypothetical protein
MKINFLKSILLTIVIVINQPTHSLASHIIGGSMNYECLGNNQYKISLKIYRDCENGNPGAYFDDSLVIGVFDAQNNTYINSITILMTQNSNDTITNYYPDTCLAPNICVHTADYTTTITLPFNSSGYILSYQRCCRANVVVNFLNPNTAGMTLATEITPEALSSCNSSPIFNREVPLVLGINDTLSINLGATDTDGDSLVYALYAPFNGATSANPVPNPPSAPPYNSISYFSPYNSQMPFGNGLCTWDSLNGDFVVAPTNFGYYVVGFSILEYNTSGVLLSKTYKDIVIIVTQDPCASTININKIAPASIVKLFPNPVKNHLTIETSTKLETTLTLYSIQGQLLMTKPFREQTTLDLNQYPKGVYLLKFENEAGQIVKRFIKE